MAKRKSVFLLMGALVFGFGCADRHPIPEEAGFENTVAPIGSYSEYRAVWKATYSVLQKYFLIRVSRYEDGYIVATSRLRDRGGQMTRTKIVGQVVENEDGFFEPQVRATLQMDLSDPLGHARTIRQPHIKWHNLDFDRTLEVRLMNEIQEELRGKPNPFSRLSPMPGNPRKVAARSSGVIDVR
ncbi:MAG: hypothetical protein QF752_03015 [Planctomycetota bacterium]|jgi:hypothetical protein|nr:hypothetical protein [Planctomycetota bacterium]